jgi:hypothetical protein
MLGDSGVTFTADEISFLADEHPILAAFVIMSRTSDKKINAWEVARRWEIDPRDAHAAAFQAVMHGLVPIETFTLALEPPF